MKIKIRNLYELGRDELKKGLAECSDGEILVFKRMYAKGKLTKNINNVVDDMPDEKIAWSLEQVITTLNKKIK